MSRWTKATCVIKRLMTLNRAPEMTKSTGYGARQSLGYLLNRTADIVATAASEVLREHSISLLEWRVITVLTDNDKQSLSELAAHAGCELSYLSRVVSLAEGQGYVTRFTSADDRRSTKVGITEAGLAFVRSLTPQMKALEKEWLQGISAADAEVLRRALPKLYANVLTLHAMASSGRKLKVAARVKERTQDGR
jgi:DNA-binding MarR family transcriptional regulator